MFSELFLEAGPMPGRLKKPNMVISKDDKKKIIDIMNTYAKAEKLRDFKVTVQNAVEGAKISIKGRSAIFNDKLITGVEQAFEKYLDRGEIFVQKDDITKAGMNSINILLKPESISKLP